jgi:NAD(P)-dependent dehydrogenase (short-subunit alcohol dehydrogenase family)
LRNRRPVPRPYRKSDFEIFFTSPKTEKKWNDLFATRRNDLTSAWEAYCASKFAVVGLTKVLASEWAGRGVTANSISPTVGLTELGKAAWDNPNGDAIKKLIPTGRFLEPEEVAATAIFLASDASDMINGADLLIDGGYTVR